MLLWGQQSGGKSRSGANHRRVSGFLALVNVVQPATSETTKQIRNTYTNSLTLKITLNLKNFALMISIYLLAYLVCEINIEKPDGFIK